MKLHFIGIGGIGMSGLALMALQKGYEVSGSDSKESEILTELKNKGAKISSFHDESLITNEMQIVISTAILDNNPELKKAKNLGCKIFHRSDYLLKIMEEKKSIMVSGAHGKTTTTALLAHVFSKAGLNPSYAIGGIVPNGVHAKLDQGEFFIFEGDESDGSFLNANPTAAIFTNIDEEHLDYWKSFDNLLAGFQKAIKKIENPQHVFVSFEDPHLKKIATKSVSYGINESADLSACAIRYEKNGTYFFIKGQKQEYFIPLYGEHNVKNALAVIGVAQHFGISCEKIKKAFSTFPGVKRRFEKVGECQNTVFIDDYAHHPIEINALIQVLEKLTDLKKICLIFQPHRYKRFQALKEDFAKVLSKSFHLIALPVYGAGEEKIEGLYEDFLKKVKPEKLTSLSKEQIQNWLEIHSVDFEMVITVGAGDVTEISRNFCERQKIYSKPKL